MPSNYKALTAMLAIALGTAGCGGGGSAPVVPPPPPPVVDTFPPETTFTGGPPALTALTSAEFLVSSEFDATIEASLDGAAYATVPRLYTLNNLTDGQHTINFRARDAAGNVDASPATHTWIVETVPPTAKIWFPGNVAYTDASTIQVRAYVLDSQDISSVTMNGVAATYSFATAMWVARVPLSIGTNTIAVATRDRLGNTNSQAATATIVNRGVALGKLNSLAFDGAHGRVLAVDWYLNAIVALRSSDGVATIFSDSTHGTGPEVPFPRGLVVDAPRNRALTYDSFVHRVMAIDLANGNRSYITDPPPSQQNPGYGGLDYHAPSNKVYLAPGYPPGIDVIDLNNGARTTITSNSVGTGPGMTQTGTVVLDTSPAGGGARLLLAEIGAQPGSEMSRLFAVDFAGNRTVLSSGIAPIAGAGPAIYGMGDFIVDAANNRLLVMEFRQSDTQRLFAIDLANGNRTVLVDSGARSGHGSLAYDAGGARAYLGLGDRSRVLRFDLGPQLLAPFVDSNVGNGPTPVGYNSLVFDPYDGTPGVIAGVQTNPFGGAAGVMRIAILTGDRTMLVDNSIGAGPPLYLAQSVQRDFRPGGNLSQFLVLDTGTIPGSLYSTGPPFGDRRLLSTTDVGTSANADVALDPVSGQLLAGVARGTAFGLVGIDVATGAQTMISGTGRGAGPAFGIIVAIAVDNRMGSPRRYHVATQSPTALIVVDPTTGNRALFSGSGAGTGPPLTDPVDIDLDVGGGLLVLGGTGTLQAVDVTNGNRSHVSGVNTADQSMRGTGPLIIGAGSKVTQLTSNNAYVISSENSILAVDLESGDRAIVSR